MFKNNDFFVLLLFIIIIIFSWMYWLYLEDRNFVFYKDVYESESCIIY